MNQTEMGMWYFFKSWNEAIKKRPPLFYLRRIVIYFKIKYTRKTYDYDCHYGLLLWSSILYRYIRSIDADLANTLVIELLFSSILLWSYLALVAKNKVRLRHANHIYYSSTALAVKYMDFTTHWTIVRLQIP